MLGRRVDVVSESEALLSGSYVEYLKRRGQQVPSWAWINLLAHGSEDALRTATRLRRAPIVDMNVWWRARRYLAGEVLAAADRAGSLESLQSTVLVPLELALMCARPVGRPRPGTWAASVLGAIEAHLSPRRSDA